MRQTTIKKVVIIGPESTGKSTLCQQLADHYHTIWCPEYAREYLLEHGMDYSYDDLLTIARGQLRLEEDALQLATGNMQMEANHPGTQRTSYPVFIDTNMYVMKVWCEFVFGKCHSFILDKIKKRRYNLYLLCNVDLPWVKDELREYPDLERRQKLYDIYKKIMERQSVPWVEISGDAEERIEKAITAVDLLIEK